MTMPNGDVNTFKYLGTDNLHDNAASRVSRITRGETALVAYKYNGVDNVAGTLYPQPDVMWLKYDPATSESYPDLDRFNRVTSSRWTKDLSTDIDFFATDIAYDRNSNITSVTDNVHTGFDVVYTNDDLNRLERAEEGTISGGSITSRTRDQQWTLNQTGNWDFDKVDLNGDGDFTDTDELFDDRTHNEVNELTGRDIDDSGSDDYTLTYDAAGNMTDDGENYEYVWDAFYRLRKVNDTGDQSLVAEYKYNGLNYRISRHEDTDTDGDVDGNDKWFHTAYDERWRGVATFRESDSDPKEQLTSHNAGFSGYGTGSYIDLVALRDKDANTAWTAASDGTLEQRVFYCQNWRADAVAVVAAGGKMLEWVKYSAYGVPFGLPGGDTDSDGDCDATDVTQVQAIINASGYDIRADVDLDGDVDSTDKTIVTAQFSGTSLGRRSLSFLRNRRGWGGLVREVTDNWSARNRDYRSELGRWMQRDQLGYVDGISLYRTHSPVGISSRAKVRNRHGDGVPVAELRRQIDVLRGIALAASLTYGEHCGAGHGKWGSSGGGEPIDELDEACSEHDDCYLLNNVPLPPAECGSKSPGQDLCDAALCAAGQKAKACGASSAEKVAGGIIADKFCCDQPPYPQISAGCISSL